MTRVTVVGAGLAGCEAAWTLAQNGIPVTLWEMKPRKFSPAHHSPDFAELICSNSLKASRLESAAGLLKAEMERLGSLCVPCAKRQLWLPAAPWLWTGTGSQRWSPKRSAIIRSSPSGRARSQKSRTGM